MDQFLLTLTFLYVVLETFDGVSSVLFAELGPPSRGSHFIVSKCSGLTILQNSRWRGHRQWGPAVEDRFGATPWTHARGCWRSARVHRRRLTWKRKTRPLFDQTSFDPPLWRKSGIYYGTKVPLFLPKAQRPIFPTKRRKSNAQLNFTKFVVKWGLF